MTGRASESTSLAVQQLAAAPTQIEIPDYTDTLVEIRGGMQELANHYRQLRDAPALAVTPDKLAARIDAASVAARSRTSITTKRRK